MKVISDIKLDFDNVLIKPKRSCLKSRSDVNLQREFRFPHSKKTWTGIPIISSNMTSVGTIPIYNVLSQNNILTCLHKFHDVNDLRNNLPNNNYMLSCGISDSDFKRLTNISEYIEPEFICIDVPNGYCNHITDFTRKIRELYPDVILACGNVVTGEMVQEYILNGYVDICKIGIGSGSHCTTRMKTGVGYPQLSAIMETADSAHGCNGHIISDGGIVNVGDISKAFGAGADFCMMGSMFAGHHENPGKVINKDGNQYKTSYGMSSNYAMNTHYGYKAKYRTSEGRFLTIPLKGYLQDTVDDILGGLRSTGTYIGAKNIKDFSKCTTFVRVNNQLNTSLL